MAARNRPPRSLPAWPARFAAFAALAAAACLNAADDTAGTEFEEASADDVMYVVSHNMSKDGIREARLEADSMLMWNDSTHSWVMRMTLRVYDERGGQRATITADRGRFDMATNELMAVGNAVLSIPGQDREIRTEVLNVSQDSDRVWSDVTVVMREAGCEIEGDRLESDISFNQVKLWGTRERDCPER
ncbi:MAG: LPS export ABC transporter periplasmic protein LptC [Gemmatimonadota bacterium]|nr:LPS export ABC transporter periplasmic protein LptC [Gemmatimonadota bacterium]MDE2983454.1 LPS export ABC transporter periplasmic protein LptC [Gemmatimonadota bacterium]